jgi:hypothetical protein
MNYHDGGHWHSESLEAARSTGTFKLSELNLNVEQPLCFDFDLSPSLCTCQCATRGGGQPEDATPYTRMIQYCDT